MGMLDSELMLSAAQAATAIGDTASTNVYDAGGANGQGDAGLTGENLWLNCFINTACTSGGAATIQAVLQDSADNAAWADVVAGPALAMAAALAGVALLQVQPPAGMRRYHRIAYRIGAFVLTGGKFDAYYSNTIQKNVPRPSGFTVS